MSKNKEKYTKGSVWWGVLIFALLVLVDQLTKAFAEAYFTEGTKIPVIDGWIYLTLTHNPGISYGAGSNWPEWGKIALVIGTGVVMLALAIMYFKMDKRRSFLRTAFIFVVAGGVGNLIDRLYYKVWTLDATALTGVRDMVDLNRLGFAVCNFADFFISAGAVMLVLALLFFDREAFFPVGKYKALRKEADEAEEAENAVAKVKSNEDKDTL